MKLVTKAAAVMAGQSYRKAVLIEGVKIVQINKFLTEDGAFNEVVRLDKGRLVSPVELKDFPVAQINHALMVPGAVKAWHLHLKQDEIWFVEPEGCLLVGLLDVREESPSSSLIMRLVLGRGQASLLYIPRGVAHGAANLYEKPAAVTYLANNHFEGSDEKRLPPDFGVEKNFWQLRKE